MLTYVLGRAAFKIDQPQPKARNHPKWQTVLHLLCLFVSMIL